MKISEIPDDFSATLIRDGEFLSLGKTRHTLERMIVFLESAQYISEVQANPHISCVITTPGLIDNLPDHLGIMVSDSPRNTFYDLHRFLDSNTDFYWEHFETEIDPTAIVHPDAFISTRDVRIGPGSFIGPKAVILDRTIIGEDVRILPGVVLSTEGYEVRRCGNRLLSVPHAGAVRLSDGVEIFTNSAVARPIFNDYTTICCDTKIDSFVYIAHNVKIGERCRIAGLASVGGNVIIGDDVWVGPRSIISNGLRIGDEAKITIGSVVVRDVPRGGHVTGYFGVDHQRFLMNWAKTVGPR